METNEANGINNAIDKFFFFGVSSLTKALVFRTLAKQALATHERILAAISGYYSLFHLVMAISYLCPQVLESKRRREIYDTIERSGGLDPSESKSRIRHNEAPCIIKKCRGLEECVSLLEEGKELREYVNYGPRMSIKNGPSFGECRKPEIVDRFIAQLDNCLLKGLKWYQCNSINEGNNTMPVLSLIGQFLDNRELFYMEWCSQEIIEKSKIFLKKIFQELEK